MKKISAFDTFISTRMMATLILVFAVAIGVATFIEDAYDTITAQRWVFHAAWFKTVIVLLCVNFIGNIKRYRLLRREKLSILAIHIGMILTIVGAAVTHYIGFEGTVTLAEGESTDKMYSQEPYVSCIVFDKSTSESTYSMPHIRTKPSEYCDNYFIEEFDLPAGRATIEYKDYKSDMKLGDYKENVEGGINYLEVVFGKMISEYIPEGGSITKNGLEFTFNKPVFDGVNITLDDSGIPMIYFDVAIQRMSMQTKEIDTIQGAASPLLTKHLHQVGNVNMVFKGVKYRAKQEIVKSEENGMGVMTVEVKYAGQTKQAMLWGGISRRQQKEFFEIEGQLFQLGFGSVERQLPYTITLNDVIMETYPGTTNPSGYKSKVTLTKEDGSTSEHEIFMNNVLDDGGYRFFQSSYENDGTVEVTSLSVNHDFWGTTITYIAYLMLSLGFIFTLLNNTSRFSEVLKIRLKKLRKKRDAMRTMIVLLIGLTSFAQVEDKNKPNKEYVPIAQEHCDEFNSLLVMSYIGRIQPVNSLGYDLIRKLYRKDSYYIESADITISPEQLLLDMPVDPEFWVDQKIIKFDARSGIGADFNIEGKYLAYSDLYDVQFFNGNILVEPKTFVITVDGEEEDCTIESLNAQAQAKNVAKRGTYDKEIIKLTEKLAIFQMAFYGDLLKIFPGVVEGEEKWVGVMDTTVKVDKELEDGRIIEVEAREIVYVYYLILREAKETGDYSKAKIYLDKFKLHQRSTIPAENLPSESMVGIEIFYNQANIFSRLKNIYMLLGLVLLPLALWQNLSLKFPKIMEYFLKGFFILFILAVTAHFSNLMLRWYIIGHAPWSDGYEALTFIAFGTVLAGTLFYRSSKITAGATALLAFFILMTAGHSKYDPQMTLLVPVLKSYWLNIHVACLTISYSFFGLGFILGLVNMFVFALRKQKTKLNEMTITELSYVMEMTLTIGLVLATIGTFLGGVWANESWGRYWGWDAKETWALVIVLYYAFVLHMRFVPGLRGTYAMTLASTAGFSTVIMTFVGVNYYLTKGLHSYARGGKPDFPNWMWIVLCMLIALFVVAYIRNKKHQLASKEIEE
ncbi:MAG: cytochrome c-type biogenesis protein CcsB [Flavobacteriales bacterium]|jgi:cytochrome c-type biogenesis protein CcsB